MASIELVKVDERKVAENGGETIEFSVTEYS